jgi:uncharacterized membrane protein
MQQMLGREVRMVDAQIIAALQNGTAFFASTSLIAVGGALTLMRSTTDILKVVAALPFGIEMTAEQWEAKTVGLAVIFVYAFFKFAWSYPSITTWRSCSARPQAQPSRKAARRRPM